MKRKGKENGVPLSERIGAAARYIAWGFLWLLLYVVTELLTVPALPLEWRAAVTLIVYLPVVYLLDVYMSPDKESGLPDTLPHRAAMVFGIGTGTDYLTGLMFISIAAGLGLNLALSAAMELIPLPADLLSSYAEAASPLTDVSLISILSSVVFVPLLEETVFRGLMLRTLRRGIGTAAALITVTVIFALMHSHPLWIAYAAVCGLILGAYYLLFDSTVPSIMLHLGFNAFNYIRPAFPEPQTSKDHVFCLILGLCAFALATAAAVFISKKQNKNKENENG